MTDATGNITEAETYPMNAKSIILKGFTDCAYAHCTRFFYKQLLYKQVSTRPDKNQTIQVLDRGMISNLKFSVLIKLAMKIVQQL